MTPEDRIRAISAKYDDGNGEGEALAQEALERLAWRRRRGGKECARCGETKPVGAFGAHPETRDGLRGVCKDCRATESRESGKLQADYIDKE